MSILIWQKWQNPEWIHLLVSACGVRLLRTYPRHGLLFWIFGVEISRALAFCLVFAIGIAYEFVIWRLFGHRPSITDIIADLIGAAAGAVVL